MRLVMYQPDQAANVGAAVRLCACLGFQLEVIEPCGFVWDPAKMKNKALDYSELLTVKRHVSWEHFWADLKPHQPPARAPSRLVLLTTKGSQGLFETKFLPSDVLLVGRESAGVPEAVHQAADARVRIPMQAEARSLNVVISASMVMTEMIRQCSPSGAA